MTKDEIIKNNVLIAEYMGHTIKRKHYPYIFKHRHYEAEGLQYHSSWEWLMLVVEQICRHKVGDGIITVEYAYPRTFGMLNEDSGQIMVRLNGFPKYEADSLIEATYLSVVEFINYLQQDGK